MIELNDISKIYRIGDEEIRALDSVSMRVKEGEFVSITGSSGSGKSTMMHIIGCLDTADEGVYLLDGQSIEHYSENELAMIRNQKIGFIFQSFNLIARLTLEENVGLPLVYRGVSASLRRERVGAAMEQVGLANRMKHTPNSISGGQQQRAAIARALVTEPAMILADEPTGNLDSKTGESIMKLFRNLNAAGKTIVLITHDDHIAQQTGRTIRLMDGRIESMGRTGVAAVNGPIAADTGGGGTDGVNNDSAVF
ncbi:MAG: ABC transporter ATP-binding protein [Clostridiales Family XIII bacterium]|jgi:putative ABC transport system ATP-binding protein|nr:ABC transporter ATP-binding protein [Clostridiales Family XIII bacterium]